MYIYVPGICVQQIVLVCFLTHRQRMHVRGAREQKFKSAVREKERLEELKTAAEARVSFLHIYNIYIYIYSSIYLSTSSHLFSFLFFSLSLPLPCPPAGRPRREGEGRQGSPTRKRQEEDISPRRKVGGEARGDRRSQQVIYAKGEGRHECR